jgi:hypothetical protein
MQAMSQDPSLSPPFFSTYQELALFQRHIFHHGTQDVFELQVSKKKKVINKNSRFALPLVLPVAFVETIVFDETQAIDPPAVVLPLRSGQSLFVQTRQSVVASWHWKQGSAPAESWHRLSWALI